MVTIDPAILLALRVFLAAILAAAALHKFSQGARFVAIVRDYRVAPSAVAPLIAFLVAAAEAATAAALLIGGGDGAAALAAAALFGLYGAVIALNLARGRVEIDCGCSFGGAASGDRLSGALLVRNAALVLFALIAAAPSAARAVGAADTLVAIIGASAFAALYFAADVLIANAARFAATERRA